MKIRGLFCGTKAVNNEEYRKVLKSVDGGALPDRNRNWIDSFFCI